MDSVLFSCSDIQQPSQKWNAETDTIPLPPSSDGNYRGHTLGIVISPDDSIPPQVEHQPSPKSMLEEIRVKPSDTFENK